MARFRKATPVRDNLPGILAGIAASLLVLFLIWAVPRAGPAVKGFLADFAGRPSTESAAPVQEEGSPSGEAALPGEEEGALPEALEASPEESGARKLGDRLWLACKKFWPVIPVFITVMETAEYMGKLCIWVKKLFR